MYRLNATPGLLMILVRHGRTEGNDPTNPQVRGWQDYSLEDKSIPEVKGTAEALRQYAPQSIISSDFQRDMSTAHILASALNLSNIETDYDARTWDTGMYSGKPEAEVNSAIAAIYDRPWESAPGGRESFNAFQSRWQNFLDRKMDLATVEGFRPMIVVTHGRNIALTDSYINGKMPRDGQMPFPAGYGLLSVAQDGSLGFGYPVETEPVIEDV